MPSPSEWLRRAGELNAVENQLSRTDPLPEELSDIDRSAQLGELAKEDVPVSTWSGFRQWLKELGGRWVYRGHATASWLLHTSLDRQSEATPYAVVGRHRADTLLRLDSGQCEKKLMEEFRQRGFARASDFHSLARIQHYGGPTRLLDWTYDPFVALYFALQEAPNEPECAVWAIDTEWLVTKSSETLGQRHFPPDWSTDLTNLDRFFFQDGNPSVIVPVDDPGMDERMRVQKALFLCNVSRDCDEPFWNSLLRMILRPGPPGRAVVRKLIVKTDHWAELRHGLCGMGIHHSGLFPGDDFAEFLGDRLKEWLDEFKEKWRLKTIKDIRDEQRRQRSGPFVRKR